MFYTQFIKLCNEQKKEPSLVAEAIGLNRSSATANIYTHSDDATIEMARCLIDA